MAQRVPSSRAGWKGRRFPVMRRVQMMSRMPFASRAKNPIAMTTPEA
jgi:hypothetical protein